MKFLDKFYNCADVPRVSLTWNKFYSNSQTAPQARSPVGSFQWKDILKFFENFQEMAICSPSKGNTVLFWSDSWTDQPLKEKFPQLYSFTRKLKCSIRFFIDQDVERTLSLPLSTQAADQLQVVDSLLQDRNWDDNVKDIWSYSWGSSKYSSKKAYNILIGVTAASPLFKWLWASSNLGKHKFFFWLLLRDRLNTRNLLRRKNMELDDYSCELCNSGCENQLSSFL